jgi:hypothetical protein
MTLKSSVFIYTVFFTTIPGLTTRQII